MIPNHDDILLPLLHHLADCKAYTQRQLIKILAWHFNLNATDRSARAPGKQEALFNHRTGWARTYLTRARLIQSAGRRRCRITPRGLEILRRKPKRITTQSLKQFPDFQHTLRKPPDKKRSLSPAFSKSRADIPILAREGDTPHPSPPPQGERGHLENKKVHLSPSPGSRIRGLTEASIVKRIYIIPSPLEGEGSRVGGCHPVTPKSKARESTQVNQRARINHRITSKCFPPTLALPLQGGGDKTFLKNDYEDALHASYQTLRQNLAADLLEKIKQVSPSFFERLVVDVLVAMGYGGSRKDTAKTLGRSGDGGVDGIIKEDHLGLDVIYIQAKRWENPVGRPEVQAFAGSLEGFRAKKGVFMTTSRFTKEAREYVERISSRIILIDGQQLADWMIDFNVGTNEYQRYIVKKLDCDYFEEG